MTNNQAAYIPYLFSKSVYALWIRQCRKSLHVGVNATTIAAIYDTQDYPLLNIYWVYFSAFIVDDQDTGTGHPNSQS